MNAAKFPQIQVPSVALRVQALFSDPRDKRIVILYPLPPTGNLTIAFRRQEVHGECDLGGQWIRLVIESLRLLRIPRHKKRTIKVRRQNLLLLISQIITSLDPRLFLTDHLERIVVGDSWKWRLDLL